MRKRRELGQPSDIAFLLIIFFLLLAGISTSRALSLQLPAEAAGEEQENKQLTLILERDGSIFSESGERITEAIETLINPATDLTLSIVADVPWQVVVDTLARIDRCHPASLSLEESL